MKRLAVFFMVLLLAACSRDKPSVTVENELAVPPWETFIKAGYGAEYEIDLETLNGPDKAVDQAPPVTPEQLDANSEPHQAAPEQKQASSDAVAIKSVAVPPVTGMDARSNGELTAAMRDVLRTAGWPVIESARADALTIQGNVQLAAATGATQKVTLSWTVLSPKGASLGEITQSNDVPAGSLANGWGSNATAASQAAAQGIFELIGRYR